MYKSNDSLRNWCVLSARIDGRFDDDGTPVVNEGQLINDSCRFFLISRRLLARHLRRPIVLDLSRLDPTAFDALKHNKIRISESLSGPVQSFS